ncbi:MAG: hypothetical protein LBT30_03875 [Clostridiales bacterium]|jgi:hypothetical protein|nr:hypothetical protein [Clostridiales bacterium]
MKKTKRFIVVAVLIAAIAAVAAVVIAALKKDDDFSGNISYADENVYLGQNANFAVSVYAGKAEKNFLTDGRAVDVVKFCKVSLTLLNTAYSKAASFDYQIIAGDTTLSGVLNKDIMSSEYIGEIEVPDPSAIESAVIKYSNSKSDLVALDNVLAERLSFDDAYKAALNVFAKEIKENTKNGSFNREIYIKFVTGYSGEEPYYWYVAFIASDSDYWAVLLDSKTGETEVKR